MWSPSETSMVIASNEQWSRHQQTYIMALKLDVLNRNEMQEYTNANAAVPAQCYMYVSAHFSGEIGSMAIALPSAETQNGSDMIIVC